MAKRGHVHDFTGAQVHIGDVIVYGARVANLVRMTEAVVVDITTERQHHVIRPVLKVRPTGRESGFLNRETYGIQTIRSEHWAVTVPMGEQTNA